MNTAHFFAGAGGGLYADLILGHTPVLAVEWDKYAAGALQQRADDGWFPELHVHHGDIQLFDPSPWKGRVDSLHAGFPCQDISVAGNGKGITGERSGLWSEVVRGARLLGVNELFLENSPAIVSRGLDVALGNIADLGFSARWCVIPASSVGAQHFRARWWCLARNVANPNSIGIQGIERGNPNPQMRPEQNQRSIGSQGNAHGWWSVEPGLGRVANGVANRGNRIKCLGNGQVPLQAAAAYKLLDAMF